MHPLITDTLGPDAVSIVERVSSSGVKMQKPIFILVRWTVTNRKPGTNIAAASMLGLYPPRLPTQITFPMDIVLNNAHH